MLYDNYTMSAILWPMCIGEFVQEIVGYVTVPSMGERPAICRNKILSSQRTHNVWHLVGFYRYGLWRVSLSVDANKTTVVGHSCKAMQLLVKKSSEIGHRTVNKLTPGHGVTAEVAVPSPLSIWKMSSSVFLNVVGNISDNNGNMLHDLVAKGHTLLPWQW